MTKSSIGDRMKRYEAAYDFMLTPKSPLIIRVDGRAFHTFLRHAERPFDNHVIDSMLEAARYTASHMQGFKLAYVQSDECTFVLTDYDDFATQGWFDYSLSKVVSISASTFTAKFNQVYTKSPGNLATFDSRAFIVPVADVPNIFVWRQRDWERNSVQMLTRAHFSHRECIGKKARDMHDMLHGIGVNWAHLDNRLKNGTFLTSEGSICLKLSYQEISFLISPIENGE